MMYRYVHKSKYTNSLDNSPIENVFSETELLQFK